MTESSQSPLSGLWKPHHLKHLYYGPSCVEKNLVNTLPSKSSKAFIVTGSSLATKTPLVSQLESLLGSTHHAGTFSSIKQHAPVKQLDEALEIVSKDSNIDTVITLGGGSPIDSGKAISLRLHEKTGKYLTQIAIPTTLSAAECTCMTGYTKEDGSKTVEGQGIGELAPSAIFYDPGFAKYTPARLWHATALRAMDHAVELMYHRYATEMPARRMAISTVAALFEYLPKSKDSHPHDEEIMTSLFLTAFASLGFLGLNYKGGLGLSHALGYALGSPYGIPHGETSCLTLGHVIKLKAKTNNDDAAQLARLLPSVGGSRSGDDVKDAIEVGDRILKLVKDLGLQTTLTEKGVGQDQLPIITQRATGGKTEGPVYDAVAELVKGLY